MRTGQKVHVAGGGGGLDLDNTFYAECNSPPTTNNMHLTFDTFYDLAQNVITGVPVGSGLVLSGADFQAAIDGTWYVRVVFHPNIALSPNVLGLGLDLPFYLNDVSVNWGQNLNQVPLANYPPSADTVMEAVVPMRAGGKFGVYNQSANPSAGQAVSGAAILIGRWL